MPKRNSVIVLSSDEEEENAPKTRSFSSTRSKPKPEPKSTSTGSRGRKKARVSTSASRLSKLYEVISITLSVLVIDYTKSSLFLIVMDFVLFYFHFCMTHIFHFIA